MQDTSNKKKIDVVELHKQDKLDIWVTVGYLGKYKRGPQDFLVNHLYSFSDNVIEFFLPQLSNILLKDSDAHCLLRYLMDKCSSLQLAFKMFCWLQAAVEDNVYPRQRTTGLWHECEMAAVNSKSRSAMRIESYFSNNSISEYKFALYEEEKKTRRHTRSSSMPSITLDSLENHAKIQPSSSLPQQRKSMEVKEVLNTQEIIATNLNTISSSISDLTSAGTLAPNESSSSHSSPSGSPRHTIEEEPTIKISEITDAELQYTTKRARHHFFHLQIEFISALLEASSILKRKGLRTKTENNKELNFLLRQIQNDIVSPSVEVNVDEVCKESTSVHNGVYLPISRIPGIQFRVLRILPGDSFCLNSRDRVPYMLYVETVAVSEHLLNSKNDNNNNNNATSASSSSPRDKSEEEEDEEKDPKNLNESVDLGGCDEPPAPNSIVNAIDHIMVLNRNHHLEEQRKSSSVGEEDWVVVSESNEEEINSTLRMAYPEFWAEKEERIRKTSPYGHMSDWKLQSIIIKSGDDLRQEQLAVQLILSFHKIFKRAELPIWLHPYSVVATSSDGGLIETIPDAISLDTLKKRIPNAKTLEDYFTSAYGDRTSMRFLTAQRNFVESLAGYSLICYLLQIKDRHNGNILIDKEGHIIHIDYGFMLTSSPGGMGFETAPFKLTDEFIKVMGGDMSDMANYFKLLLIRGFLEVRKHYQKILMLVENLLPGYKMRCFARRDSVVQELKDRFRLELTDKECVTYIADMIKESARNWRTGSYDNYQYYLNGILA